MTATPILHATAIARWRAGAWRGVLLRGRSGAGKSSLALRAIEAGWRLVADDRTLVWRSGGRLFARAPQTIRGLVEARGLGVLPQRHLELVELALAVDLAEADEALERVPDPETTEVAGAVLPLVRIRPHEAAATEHLALALEQALASSATVLGLAGGQAYQARRAGAAPQGQAADGGLL